MIIAAILSLFYLFDPSTSSDLSHHKAAFYMREIIPVPCQQGQEPPCFGTSDLVSVPWAIVGEGETSDLRAYAPQPLLNQCIMGHLWAVDLVGNDSEKVAE